MPATAEVVDEKHPAVVVPSPKNDEWIASSVGLEGLHATRADQRTMRK